MLLLASTSDKLRLTTSAAINVDVHASYVDLNGSTVTPGRQNTAISTAATTDIVSSPGASTYRTVKTLTIRNRNASTVVKITLIHTDGTNAMQLVDVTLPAGFTLCYDEQFGFKVLNTFGNLSMFENYGGIQAAVNSLNIVVLSSDVTNNNATANTIADVTGLSFSVNANETYYFQFNIWYTAAATTTGSRWSINGPGSPTRLAYRSNYSLTSTSETTNSGLTAYDLPAAANASSTATTTGGNIATIEGLITPSAAGTVIARFASEVASSAIVAKAGSSLRWIRVL